MSKTKEEELLESLENWVGPIWRNPRSMYPGSKDERAYKQIKEMIKNHAEQEEIEVRYIEIILDLYDRLEKKVAVTEGFVEKWNQVIAERVNVKMKKDFIREEISLVYPGTENLAQMLAEAGVEIRETQKNVKK